MSVAMPAPCPRGTVLLLEPDDSLAELLRGLLGEWGFGCERVRSPDEVIARLRFSPPEVLVLSERAGESAAIDRVLAVGRLPGRAILLAADEGRVALDGQAVRVLLKPSELDVILYEVEAAARLARPVPVRRGASAPSGSR